jgi:hypothetical protein
MIKRSHMQQTNVLNAKLHNVYIQVMRHAWVT